MKEQISNLILDFFKSQNINDIKFNLNKPKQIQHGDFSTNAALVGSSKLKLDLHKTANLLADYLSYFDHVIDKVEVADRGFVNIWLLKTNKGLLLQDVLAQKNLYGSSVQEKPIRVNIEYVSANPTGLLHLGHARNAAIGNSLYNILKFAGYQVTGEYYINDYGNQINLLTESVYVRYQQLFQLAVNLPEDSYGGIEIIECAKKLKEKYNDQFLNSSLKHKDPLIRKFALNFMLEMIKSDLTKYRVNFDLWTSESDLYADKTVEKLLTKLQGHKFLYSKDGALWLKTSALGDDKDRVLVKSDKSQTYFLADLAYHLLKINRGADWLIDIWGADHHGYVKRMVSSIELLNKQKCDVKVNIMQMVRLIKDGQEIKMSKRKGTVITLASLLTMMSVDSARYFMVSRSMNTHVDININMATAQNNQNPVFYVQYAYARACRLLEKAEAQNIVINDDINLEYISSDLEQSIINLITDFPDLIQKIAQNSKIHNLTNYLQKLAKFFHSYYNEYQIINSNAKDHNISKNRLLLVKCCQQVIKNGLKLIGVSAPNKM